MKFFTSWGNFLNGGNSARNSIPLLPFWLSLYYLSPSRWLSWAMHLVEPPLKRSFFWRVVKTNYYLCCLMVYILIALTMQLQVKYLRRIAKELDVMSKKEVVVFMKQSISGNLKSQLKRWRQPWELLSPTLAMLHESYNRHKKKGKENTMMKKCMFCFLRKKEWTITSAASWVFSFSASICTASRSPYDNWDYLTHAH